MIATVRADAASDDARPARGGVESRRRPRSGRRRGARALRRPVPPQRPVVVGDQRRARGEQAGGAQALLARHSPARAIHARTFGDGGGSRGGPCARARLRRHRASAAGPVRAGGRHRGTGSRRNRNHACQGRRADPRRNATRALRTPQIRPSRRAPSPRSSEPSRKRSPSGTTTSAPSTCCSRCSATRTISRRRCSPAWAHGTTTTGRIVQKLAGYTKLKAKLEP